MENRFHLHIDAAESLPSGVAEELKTKWGFCRHDFAGHPDGYPHYEPVEHLTTKPGSGRDLQANFVGVREYLASVDFRGYVEAEVLPRNRRWQVPEIDFNSTAPLLPQLQSHRLSPGEFRQSEMHLTLDSDRSHPEAVKRLLDAGFYGAFLQKEWGRCLVLTAQGSRTAIKLLWPRLQEYLLRTGGLVRATLKEERVVRYWISHPDTVHVPPVIG